MNLIIDIFIQTIVPLHLRNDSSIIFKFNVDIFLIPVLTDKIFYINDNDILFVNKSQYNICICICGTM